MTDLSTQFALFWAVEVVDIAGLMEMLIIPRNPEGRLARSLHFIVVALRATTMRNSVNSRQPTFDRYQTNDDTANIRTDEETLVKDSRAELTPSQMVEQRLIGMLKSSSILVSQVQRRLKPCGR